MRRRILTYGVVLAMGLAGAWTWIDPLPSSIVLNQYCPPGFKRNAFNQCESRNLYMQYPSLGQYGVGGLKTGLPSGRDQFSPQQIDLGRYLFFDPLLSSDGSVSCASCHDPARGFTDGNAVSTGVGGVTGLRSAPSLWNVAYLDVFFWDGRAQSLEEQMQGPLYSDKEMANTPENLLQTINSIEDYQALFAQAFPQRPANYPIVLEEIYTAIAAFESSLISLNSRYDQYAHGYHDALSPAEIEGLNVFRSFVARCAECHTPPLFTNQQIAVLGTPEPNGLPLDSGAERVTGNPELRAGFKVPTLRNIEKTAPYMHSGRFSTLKEAVSFYTGGRGHAVPEGAELTLHWHIWEPNLSEYELERLVDFLRTLTDESFIPRTPKELPGGRSIVTLKNQL